MRVMFLSDAGGVGLNLQRAASACINLELPWNPAVLEQRIGRIHRLGQSRPIDVFNLVTEYGIEARIAQLCATKKALFSGLFDGTTDELRFEGKSSFLSDVEKLVVSAPDLEPVANAQLGDAPDPDPDAAHDGADDDGPDAAPLDDAGRDLESATPLVEASLIAPGGRADGQTAVAGLLSSLRFARNPSTNGVARGAGRRWQAARRYAENRHAGSARC